MTDENIYKILRAAKVEASEGFAERARAAVKSAADREKSLDALCDGLLRRAKICASENLADRVAKSISAKKVSLFSKAASYAGAVAAAASLAFICTMFEIPSRQSALENAFAQMSDLSAEIDNLSALVYEQEFSDLIFKRQ